MQASPDCKWVASGGKDQLIKIWDIKAVKCIQNFSLHDGPITCLKFNPTNLTLASGSEDKTVKYWDLEQF
jgi:WD40 repeat protein